MANLTAGTYKGDGMTLVITPEAKTYKQDGGHIQVNDLSAFFGVALSASSGSAKLTRGDTEIALKYEYAKNIVNLVDSTGMRILFCFQFDKLYMLDPDGEMVTILTKQ